MNSTTLNNRCSHNRSGIVLLVTIVLLVVLSTLGYTLTTRVAAQRHRDRYIIDYQAARYGCDSALKYAIATLEDINSPRLIPRPNEPDFSDVFALSELEYNQLLADWAVENTSKTKTALDDVNDVNVVNDFNDFNDANNIGRETDPIADYNEPNDLMIRGPYGPPWPCITAPVEFEIGSATVKIEIEDENAKYPFGWALLEQRDVRREALAGFEAFCEWMDLDYSQVDSIKQQIEEISEIKSFKLKFDPIRQTRTARTTRRGRRGRRIRTRRQTTKTVAPPSVHITDFAKLFHSSLIDTEILARPTVVSETRKESLLKYMGMWASSRVNINTAPRHVLEAAFTFGGDQVKIADEIIKQRRISPFENIEKLRRSLLRYSDSIDKCKNYITTESDFFTIRVTATSGVAKASAVIGIRKEKKKFKRIAVISG